MDNKHLATAFLTLVIQGEFERAYGNYVAPNMRHHNPYFEGDAQSLRKGMEENHAQFPHKAIAIKHIVEDGDFVAVHSRVTLAPGTEIAVVHLFRFQDAKIIELWDVGQPVPTDGKNEMF